ncbi:hypothetical protein MD484_g4194, partial [Candolleomyces efflorescens]
MSHPSERALLDLSDDKAKLKDYLRIAEKYRREGKELAKQGDLEAAFVLLAKAATLVLERLPKHRDYTSLLNDEQQNNLALNGQEILDQLGELKKALLERYEQWQKLHPDGEDQELTPNAKLHSTLDDRDDPSPTTQTTMDFSRLTLEDPRLRDQHKRAAEEANLWRIQREESERRDAETRDRKREAAVAAARYAAHAPAAYGSQQPSIPDASIRHHPQPEEIRRRESEDIKRRADQNQRAYPDEGMMRRQQAADEQARAMRQNMVASTTPAGIPISPMNTPTPTSSFYQQAPLYTPQGSHPPITYPYPGGPAVMPLENPSSYEGDSTDSESVRYDRDYQRRMARHRSPSRAPVYNATNPSPVTTTSPPPTRSRIGYPNLMSPHQQRQGYYPSLNSMFVPNQLPSPGGSLLFNSRPNEGLYSNILPPVSAPVLAHPLMPSYSQKPQYAPPAPPPPMPASAVSYPSYQGPTRPPPPPPPVPSSAPPTTSNSAPPEDRVSKDSSQTAVPGLKTVSLPRECLPRFLAIAKVNTSNNKETCGLLLGKDKGHKFVVTTLLIPKQHSTSDTCTMDEEELVLQFTEERSLITLGWVGVSFGPGAATAVY